MRIIVRDNIGRDVTNDREWYINTDGKIFYYTGDPDGLLYIVDNDYTWEVDENRYYEWERNYLGKWVGLEPMEIDYPSCCDGCSNNPKNGGSGICNCTLPYMENPMMYYTGTPTADYCNTATTSTGVYIFGNEKPYADNQLRDNTDRITEVVERTKKYIKEE